MEPLIILFTAFVLTVIMERIIKKKWSISFAGRLAMSVMLLFAAVGHFLYPAGMALMLPDFVPYKMEVIYATGIIEIAGAIGLLIPRYQKLTAWLLILFFVLILPANINAAIHHVNLKTATYDGSGLNYLWLRVPLQVLFMIWVYYFGVKITGEM